MIRRRKSKKFLPYGIIMVLILTIGTVFLIKRWGRSVEIEKSVFTESSRELRNPNRGFYLLYRFLIEDEKQNYDQTIAELYQPDKDTKLTLVQICLQSYRQGEITQEGLANIESLFDALETLDKQLIVRFTYDNDGQNEQYEPESIDIILRHMEQLSPILREYSRKIFILQGLFIGNWGEMHGTRYDSDEDLQKLTWQLARMTDLSTYLAVRVPAQWRSIMQSDSWHQENIMGASLVGRLGLFNDGMLGNKSDYGTYRTGDYVDPTAFPRLEREAELEFQNELCRKVPNGGEVIHDNVYNDLDNAIRDLAYMHVTYLNRAYDQTVLDKWKDTKVDEEGCFHGMDGLTYIERHLGYRLLIQDASLCYQRKFDVLTTKVTLKNVGFAPVYTETRTMVTLVDEQNDSVLSYPIDQELYVLSGGVDREDTLTLSVDIPFCEIVEKEYAVYFSIMDLVTGDPILLANTEECGQYGYRIGKFSWQ